MNIMERTELVAALREALTDNSSSGWALLQRVPLICNDIRAINSGVNEMKEDIAWIKDILWKTLIGIASGIGLIIVGVVTSLLLKAL